MLDGLQKCRRYKIRARVSSRVKIFLCIASALVNWSPIPAVAQAVPPIIVDERTFMDIIHEPGAVSLAEAQKMRIAGNIENWKIYYNTAMLCALVVSHSDPAEANSTKRLERLSKARMVNVSSYLMRLGLLPSQIQAHSSGPVQPVFQPPSVKNIRTEIDFSPCIN